MVTRPTTSIKAMPPQKWCVWLSTRDLRVTDNPILHRLASTKHGFSHFLPLHVWNAKQIEVSGFLKPGETSPYPEARSRISNFWRTGPYRLDFAAESVCNMRINLEALGSGLIQRVGTPRDVLSHILEEFSNREDIVISSVWMTAGDASEERQDQRALRALCKAHNIQFELFQDEKYLVDDRDNGLESPEDLQQNFSAYKKTLGVLRDMPRASLPRPVPSSLPPMPDKAVIPAQHHPFLMVDDLQDLKAHLRNPIISDFAPVLGQPPNAINSHTFSGGEESAMERVRYYVHSGHASQYLDIRNGLYGADYSTKLSAFLAHGCVTARQIHEELLRFEDGTDQRYASVHGFGKGENPGTAKIRDELAWRDYMRLSAIKFGDKLFDLHGFQQEKAEARVWLSPDGHRASRSQKVGFKRVTDMVNRFISGTTGFGLVDASMRELFHTGYTSNRARQNVASFLAKRLSIDWRIGAEWYETMLIDYDVSSNWGNWQYQAGVGNDPRTNREFNPVKQGFHYDISGEYVKMWVPETRDITDLHNVFQIATTNCDLLCKLGLASNVMVTDPLAWIEFSLGSRPKNNSAGRRRKGSRGGNDKFKFVQQSSPVVPTQYPNHAMTTRTTTMPCNHANGFAGHDPQAPRASATAPRFQTSRPSVTVPPCRRGPQDHQCGKYQDQEHFGYQFLMYHNSHPEDPRVRRRMNVSGVHEERSDPSSELAVNGCPDICAGHAASDDLVTQNDQDIEKFCVLDIALCLEGHADDGLANGFVYPDSRNRRDLFSADLTGEESYIGGRTISGVSGLLSDYQYGYTREQLMDLSRLICYL